MNLRSNNSKNALELCKEVFTKTKNHSALRPFVEAVLGNLLLKTNYDKKFISEIAKKGVTACSTNCIFDVTLD